MHVHHASWFPSPSFINNCSIFAAAKLTNCVSTVIGYDALIRDIEMLTEYRGL